MNLEGSYSVYILQCRDGSYYVGSTEDLSQRLKMHNAGEAAGWTSRRRPVRLVYAEAHSNQTAAVRRERQLKRGSRAKKEALIAGDLNELQRLSKRRIQ